MSVCLTFFSCDNDSPNNNTNNDPGVVMTGYKINSQSNYTDVNGVIFKGIRIGNIVNNKLFSESNENFLNGVSQGVLTQQNYFYADNLLITAKENDNKKDFFYDVNQNLIGINWTLLNLSNPSQQSVTIYYRFLYHPNNIVFVERITLPYNDPAAQIEKRSVIQFDSNNNIIKAGMDYNLDGVMDGINQFFYTNDNLTSIHRSDGTTLTFDYSNVVDNFMILNYNSYGKKVYRLLNSESYSMLASGIERQSKNLTNQEASDATYEILSNNYYKKKTKTMVYAGTDSNTTTTEFFFQ